MSSQGETVAVFGVGGIGLNVIQGAAHRGRAGASSPSTPSRPKEPLARQFGATDFVDATDATR